jgi:DNA-binding NtrC family response regulator
VSLGSSEASADPAASVLIVDDERGPRLALQLILQREFRVVTAESGERALELLEHQGVDAVTLDLKMPGLGGPETLSRLREADPELPVIIITGYGSYETAVTALQLRAFDYISKPFDSKKILQVVRTAIEQRRSHAASPTVSLEPLDDVLEAAALLEARAASWLSDQDRGALERIRASIRSVRERVGVKPTDPDLFASQKGHG